VVDAPRNGESGRERIVDGGESAAAIEEAVGLAGAVTILPHDLA